ncbi:MAG: glycosyltransferase family 4 protein [Myxococcales bacterium]
MTRKLCFVVPALDGPISGGTLYNRELCAALAARSCELTVCTLDEPRLASLLAAAKHAFVDTLYLDALPALTQAAGRPLFSLTHFLPSLVTAGRAVATAELSAPEARALCTAGGFLVTSGFMREALEPLVAKNQAILVVQPGSRARLAPPTERPKAAPLRALLVANLLPGKGILPLLEALASGLRADDRFQLSIVGRPDANPEYAANCARAIATSTALSAHVTLQGALDHDHVLLALAEADVLLSASVMESYGMALGDARATGVPIIARVGGHAAAHVFASAGGQLVNSAEELAAACLELSRNPGALSERSQRARRNALPARPWALAADELLAQLAGLESMEK